MVSTVPLPTLVSRLCSTAAACARSVSVGAGVEDFSWGSTDCSGEALAVGLALGDGLGLGEAEALEVVAATRRAEPSDNGGLPRL